MSTRKLIRGQGNYWVKQKCEFCKCIFDAYIYNVKKGFGKYCSKTCSNKAKPRGFQKGHKSLWTVESKRKFSLKMSGEKHPMWKGNFAGKIAKHARIERLKGKPNKCENCKTTKAKKYDWANVDHKYSRKIDDYVRLCRSCHRKYDIMFNNYKNLK